MCFYPQLSTTIAVEALFLSVKQDNLNAKLALNWIDWHNVLVKIVYYLNDFYPFEIVDRGSERIPAISLNFGLLDDVGTKKVGIVVIESLWWHQ